MQAIIMAGGFGTRLSPLTKTLPKPMMPIIDKPILEYIIGHLAKHGVREIAVTLGYMPETIMNYFGNGAKWGVEIEYFVEDYPLGTAGGVRNASKFVDNDFIVISGDAFTDIDITKMMASHIESDALLTMAVKTVDDIRGFGKVIVGRNGRVQSFEEKPPEKAPGNVNMGIYILSPKVLKRIPDGKFDFSRDLFPTMMSEINCYLTDCYWSDIGTLSSYYLTNNDVATNPTAFGFAF